MTDLGHREVLDRLSAWADDELDPVASAALTTHLESCASCAHAAERMRSLRAAVRDGLEAHAAPAALRARVAASLPAAAPAPLRVTPLRPRWDWRLAAAAAGVVVIAGAAWLAAVRGPAAAADRLAGEIVSSHVRSLMASHLTDVTSTDQHTVKPWFAGRLDFSPPVEDLADRGFPLLGGRLDYVGGRPVAALVYGRRQHMINLFLWPRAGGHAPAALTRQGYHALHGVAGGMEYWAVSDLNAAELATFVAALRFSAS